MWNLNNPKIHTAICESENIDHNHSNDFKQSINKKLA